MGNLRLSCFVDSSKRRPDMKHVVIAIAVAAAVSSTSLSAHPLVAAVEARRLGGVPRRPEEVELKTPPLLNKGKEQEGRLYLLEWEATGLVGAERHTRGHLKERRPPRDHRESTPQLRR